MLDFQAVRDGKTTFDALVADLARDDLREMTDEMIDSVLALIADCVDEDVNFEPVDPEAYDPYAEREEDVTLAWNLGHVIVHITASSEESAVLAAELARGVAFHGRSRYEVPWEEMKTIEQCRQRLEESRRMGLASLEIWPDKPHLKDTYQTWTDGPVVNAVGRFVLGLMHAQSHISQIRSIVHQARDLRFL
jgi:alkanesulfonate monooxygenase SsuD/methylene tetrahydromethanopterin reductase-like flavin-dependent oxidoreductase (luciferase family)